MFSQLPFVQADHEQSQDQQQQPCDDCISDEFNRLRFDAEYDLVDVGFPDADVFDVDLDVVVARLEYLSSQE